jgi:predicted GIY-YIG superfamily endonuclease
MTTFHYVYILHSLKDPARFYTGYTEDLHSRLAKHNHGEVPSTSEHKPWEIKTAVAFKDPARAAAFERYLKTASGRAFAKHHL